MAVNRINSVYTEPKNHQGQVVTTSGDNATARVGQYVDTSLTKRNVDNGVVDPDTQGPLQSGSTTLGDIRRFYANDKAEQLDSPAGSYVAPVSLQTVKGGFVHGKDPYANSGISAMPPLGG